jgi:integrase
VLASTDPTRRPLGETKLRDVTVDRVAVGSQGNEQARAPSTAKLALIALNQVFRFAVRRGWTGVNPVMQLEPGEKPRWRVEHVRILESADLATLLTHTEDAYRPLLECLAYTGAASVLSVTEPIGSSGWDSSRVGRGDVRRSGALRGRQGVREYRSRSSTRDPARRSWS